MAKILEQLKEWQYHIHIVVIAIGLTLLMHGMGVHLFHKPWSNFIILLIALEVLDVVSHMLLGALGWED